MSIDVKYRMTAITTGGREGQTRIQDGTLKLKLSTPKELGGPGGEGTNPEQLFAAGYSACFLSAMKSVGQNLKLQIPADTSVTATVGIGMRAEDGFGLDVELDVALPGLDAADAQQLVDTAHQVCPYSNAIRGNVDVRLTLV